MSNLSFFPLFLPSSFQQEAFGCDCFFHVLSCFWAGWVVVAATFLFEGFRASHILLESFLPWWKPHKMAFNMALSWKWPQHVPTFHFSLYFFHLLFSKKHLVVIVFFKCFVLFLGWLGGCGSYFFIRRVPGISHTPGIISSLVETSQNGIQHGIFLEVAPTCPTFHFSLYFFNLLFSKKHLVVIVFF